MLVGSFCPTRALLYHYFRLFDDFESLAPLSTTFSNSCLVLWKEEDEAESSPAAFWRPICYLIIGGFLSSAYSETTLLFLEKSSLNRAVWAWLEFILNCSWLEKRPERCLLNTYGLTRGASPVGRMGDSLEVVSSLWLITPMVRLWSEFLSPITFSL